MDKYRNKKKAIKSSSLGENEGRRTQNGEETIMQRNKSDNGWNERKIKYFPKEKKCAFHSPFNVDPLSLFDK